MAGGIDQVQVVNLAIARLVVERRGLRLDGDAALLFDVHRIEHLGAHFTVGQAAAERNDAIGQGGLAMVDVRDDREIADVIHQKNGLTRNRTGRHIAVARAHKKGRVRW